MAAADDDDDNISLFIFIDCITVLRVYNGKTISRRFLQELIVIEK